MLFLSYAEEDGDKARLIAEWFRGRGIPVYYWEDPVNRGGRFIDQMEHQLNTADAFLALESPYFTESPWCHRETELAILREERMRRSQPDARFIRILKIADTPHRALRFTSAYDMFDLTDAGTLDQQLRKVAASLGQSVAAGLGQAVPAVPSAATEHPVAPAPSFRNRDDELERVLSGLGNASGPHFWLVIAPPQLGKTWFTDQLAVRLAAEPVKWSARRVDVSGYPEHLRSNVPWLLGRLFSLNTPPTSIDEPALVRIAAEIVGRGRPHLCLLDSAELLPDATVRDLRAAVGEVYEKVRSGHRRNVRVAFVVASRREDEWQRLTTPEQRLTLLPLSEFKRGTVEDALSDLADQMDRPFSPAELRAYADLVYQVSEGLPAMLAVCLQWIQREQWVGMDRLSRQAEFEELAADYVQQDLLGLANLFTTRRQDARVRAVVETAFRSLVPYRLFTVAHLRHHVEREDWLSQLLTQLGWSVERLWGAMSSTALLSRTSDEPWREVQGAIRRLLFRYFHASDDDRAAAHAGARQFLETWSDAQTGHDQVIGLVECLWHEAAELRYRHAANAGEVLLASAAALFESLKPSGYSEVELRTFAARNMRNNEELRDTVAGFDGLFEELVGIVGAPEGDDD